MNNELLESALKKLNEIEKKLELYYQMLKTENELSFIMKGTYIFEEEIKSILEGSY